MNRWVLVGSILGVVMALSACGSQLSEVPTNSGGILDCSSATVSLDLRHQELVMGLLRFLAGEGAAVIVVLHDLNLAARYADRLALMNQGRLAALAPTREVLRADLLSNVYQYPVTVVQHPHLDCPLVLPVGGC